MSRRIPDIATPPSARRSPPRRTLLLAAAGTLLAAGCGFRLRGDASYPFTTLFVATDTKSSFYGELKRTLAGAGSLKIVSAAAAAEAVLELTPPNPIDDKSILSLSGGGRVREFQLSKRVVFRIHDGKGGEWLPPAEVLVRRDFSFNDSQALAKEAEERVLLQDMQTDAILQMIRRIQMAKSPNG